MRDRLGCAPGCEAGLCPAVVLQISFWGYAPGLGFALGWATRGKAEPGSLDLTQGDPATHLEVKPL